MLPGPGWVPARHEMIRGVLRACDMKITWGRNSLQSTLSVHIQNHFTVAGWSRVG